MNKEITIIGGAGHVGLAFALICTSKNIKVHIHDTNTQSIKLIKKGIMPHKEKNGPKFLKIAVKKNLCCKGKNDKLDKASIFKNR